MAITDDSVRDLLKKGERLEFTQPTRVSAEWIEELVQGHERSLCIPVWIVNCVLVGGLRLSHVTFENDFVLLGCQVTGAVDFRFSRFRRSARFSRTRFGDRVTFSGARAELDFELDGACFPDGSVFADLSVGQVFSAVGAEFGSSDFSRIDVAKFIDCGGARFKASVTFEDIQIRGDARFRGTQFSAEAKFQGSNVHGSLLFSPDLKDRPTRFAGPADFSFARVGKNADFRRAAFEKPAVFLKNSIVGLAVYAGCSFADLALFQNATIGGDAIFLPDGNPAVFRADAVFDGIQIAGGALFVGARFDGDAKIRSAEVGEMAQFRETVFSKAALFTGTEVRLNADFSGAQFGGETSFSLADVTGSLVFGESGPGTHCRFAGPADFTGLHVRQELVFNGSEFSDTVSFERISINQLLHFVPGIRGPVLFKGLVNLCSAAVQGQAVFKGTIFSGQVNVLDAVFNKEVIFEGVTFEQLISFDRSTLGTALQFCPSSSEPVRFLGGCSFHSAKVNGDAVFSSAQFRSLAVFEGFHVEGNAFFRPDAQVGHPVRFEGNAKFSGLRVLGAAEFQGTKFSGLAQFDGSVFKGQAYFGVGELGTRKVRTCFLGRAVFVSVEFCSKAIFSRTRFHSDAEFESARFRVDAHFDGARFCGERTSFAGIEVSGFAFFERAIFRKKLTLVGARSASARFGLEGERGLTIRDQTQFKGQTDLRGFAYQRITVNWRSALERQEPFDREPFSRLESALRSKGEDREANQLYLRRCKEENRRRRMRFKAAWSGQQSIRARLWTMGAESASALYHGTQGFLFGYGVRPLRLFALSCFLVLVGGYVFSLPGAVTPASSAITLPKTLNYTQALGLSLRLFVPVPALPSGEEWTPSNSPCRFLRLRYFGMSYEGYATLHRLAGALFVPLLIAVIAGLFYRGGKRS